MSSILVYGGNKQSRQKKVDELLQSFPNYSGHSDFLKVEKEEKKKSIGIEQIRLATKFLAERPLSHKNKVILVENAEILTVQAQNALLKTLEEHPSYAIIILNAKTESDLLETVVSRCRKIRANDEGKSVSEGISANEVLAKNYGGKLAWAEEFSKEEREVVIEILENWVGELRSELTPVGVQNIEIILKVKKDLENTNVSLKLALEYLALKTK